MDLTDSNAIFVYSCDCYFFGLFHTLLQQF